MDDSEQVPLLVFGDDASPSAGIAWEWICLQVWTGWELVSLHARTPEVITATEEPDLERPREWEPPPELRRIPPASAEFATVHHMVSDADPRIALCRLPSASLLVIGAGRIARPLSALAGSTSRYLLADPPAPLAVIRKVAPVRSVLAAVDGSPSSLAALEAFSRLPWAATTDVEIVTVATPDAGRPEAVQDRASGILLARLQPQRISTSVLQGRPRAALIDHLSSRDTEPDLVIAGTRGHSTLPRPHIGSVTYALAGLENVNLLVARAA